METKLSLILLVNNLKRNSVDLPDGTILHSLSKTERSLTAQKSKENSLESPSGGRYLQFT